MQIIFCSNPQACGKLAEILVVARKLAASLRITCINPQACGDFGSGPQACAVFCSNPQAYGKLAEILVVAHKLAEFSA